jgi:hypothetical protein
MTKYRVLAGIDYRTAAGKPKRAEVGDVVDDLAPTDHGWLLDCGAIEPVAPARKRTAKTNDEE